MIWLLLLAILPILSLLQYMDTHCKFYSKVVLLPKLQTLEGLHRRDHSSLSLPFCLVAFLSPALLQLQIVVVLVRKSRNLYLLTIPLLSSRQQFPSWRWNQRHWNSTDLRLMDQSPKICCYLRRKHCLKISSPCNARQTSSIFYEFSSDLQISETSRKLSESLAQKEVFWKSCKTLVTSR